MSANEAAVLAYVDAFNRGDMEAMGAIFTEDATVQGVLGSVPLAAALGVWQELHDGLQCRLEVAALADDGDQVAVRYRETGRFVGPFRGLAGHEPTGKSYELIAMEWFECCEGRIARRWGARDADAMKRQLLD